MGGRGSGRPSSMRSTTENTERIDIREMKKYGLLKPGRWREWAWNYRGERCGSINYYVGDKGVVLHYHVGPPGGDWETVIETVWYDRTPCHYGGERLWFLCPHCNKRVAVLYLWKRRFRCRHCCKLPYSTQLACYGDRMQSKCWKIRERLGITENIFESILWYQKPKGMHWKTFNRLVQQEKKANNACREAIIKKIGLKVGCGEESEYCVVE